MNGKLEGRGGDKRKEIRKGGGKKVLERREKREVRERKEGDNDERREEKEKRVNK